MFIFPTCGHETRACLIFLIKENSRRKNTYIQKYQVNTHRHTGTFTQLTITILFEPIWQIFSKPNYNMCVNEIV